jgi:ketosteroid isomerase-like protein
MGSANADLVRTAYEMFGAGDMENLQKLWTDDIAWHIGGTTRISGDHEGATGILAMFAELVGASEGTFRAELQTVVADDEQGFSLHRGTAHKGGESFEIWTVLGYRFRVGKISEIWSFDYDQTISDKLFS